MPNPFTNTDILTASQINQFYNQVTVNLAPQNQPDVEEPDYPPEPESYGDSPSTSYYKPKLFKTMPTSKKLSYNNKIHQLFGLSVTAPKDTLGLEIECEGVNLFDAPISFWTAQQDHSLRAHGSSQPVEYVLRKPSSYDDLRKALKYLVGKLKSVGSVLDDSTRTSVHVHVNCQEETMQDVIKFVCLYLVYEDLLTKWCGPSRVGNLFCLRAKDAEYFVDSLIKSIVDNAWNKITDENFRYMGCNMASLRKFGSIEFRAMKGTVDEDTIMTWVDILLKLKQKAASFESPRAIAEMFQKVGPLDFFKETFPRDLEFFERHKEDICHSMWEGMRLMRDIAYSTKWKKPSPEDEKKQNEAPLENMQDTIIVHNFSSNTALSVHLPGLGGGFSALPHQTAFQRPDGSCYFANPDGTITWDSHNHI